MNGGQPCLGPAQQRNDCNTNCPGKLEKLRLIHIFKLFCRFL